MDNLINGDDFLNRLETILSNQNGKVLQKIGELSRSHDELAEEVVSIKKDVNLIKSERPIDRRAAGKIRRAVSRRVCELLNVPLNKRERTTEEQVKYEKYSRHLFGRCYTEIPNDGNLARSSYLDTPIGKFDDAMRDIEKYYPLSGMQSFYDEIDKLATAKRIAREQGYV